MVTLNYIPVYIPVISSVPSEAFLCSQLFYRTGTVLNSNLATGQLIDNKLHALVQDIVLGF